jgi:hypothetical protein
MISNREFRRIYLMQVLLAVADAFALNFMALYLVGLGYALDQIILAATLGFSLPVFVIALMRSARAKISFSVAFAAKITAYLIALMWLSPSTMKLIYISNALVLVFFWIPYNLEFFSFATEKTRAYSGSIAIAIYPLVGLAVPALAGYTWHAHGFAVNMLVSVSILAGCTVYMLFNKAIKVRRFGYNIGTSLASLKRYRALFFLQGFWEAANFIGVPLLTLLFVRTELKLGLFFSYLGALSVVSTIMLSRLSDRRGTRTAFIYPALVLTGAATISLCFAGTVFWWILVVGVANFLGILTTPFLIAVALDAKVTGINMWAGRELLLNSGRSVGGACLLAIYKFTDSPRLAFAVLGAGLLTYALVLHLKRIYPKAEVIIPAQPAK